jgi:hypothetical protein
MTKILLSIHFLAPSIVQLQIIIKKTIKNWIKFIFKQNFHGEKFSTSILFPDYLDCSIGTDIAT